MQTPFLGGQRTGHFTSYKTRTIHELATDCRANLTALAVLPHYASISGALGGLITGRLAVVKLIACTTIKSDLTVRRRLHALSRWSGTQAARLDRTTL